MEGQTQTGLLGKRRAPTTSSIPTIRYASIAVAMSVVLGSAVTTSCVARHSQYPPVATRASPLPSLRPGEVVPIGTGVEIELLENISSESLKAGQRVPFKAVRALEFNGVTLVSAGTEFSGAVAIANPSGYWGKAGAFDLKLDPLKLADGALVHIDFHRPARVNDRGEETGETISSAIVMAYYFPLIPVALIVGARKGKPFNIRAGERYLVYVTGSEAPATTESPKP